MFSSTHGAIAKAAPKRKGNNNRATLLAAKTIPNTWGQDPGNWPTSSLCGVTVTLLGGHSLKGASNPSLPNAWWGSVFETPSTSPEVRLLRGLFNTDPHQVFGGFWMSRVNRNMRIAKKKIMRIPRIPVKHGELTQDGELKNDSYMFWVLIFEGHAQGFCCRQTTWSETDSKGLTNHIVGVFQNTLAVVTQLTRATEKRHLMLSTIPVA